MPFDITYERSKLLFQASIQKFLAYSVVGAATFVGYVQAASEAHSAPKGVDGLVLSVVVLLLAAVVVACVAAAARQYYLIAGLESELSLRGLERDLSRGAAPLIFNITAFAHGLGYSARQSRRVNALTAIALLIGLSVLLVLVWAIT